MAISEMGHGHSLKAANSSRTEKADSFRQVTEKEDISFIKKNIICRYGIPSETLYDNGSQFVGKNTIAFCAEWNINLVTSTPAYPKANGQAESSNKVVISCLKKKLKTKRGIWAEELPLVLWVDRTTPITSTRQTPYSLVYGCEPVILVEVHVLTSRYGLNSVEANDSSCEGHPSPKRRFERYSQDQGSIISISSSKKI
ncbi:uncharacterized protein LOC141607959 [Silene latifolia]|uniref:uncharacterized protein LOC141607959 n=1 Tax=Silene latifolia TaxID=37657 RepID=UPI003D774732